MRALLHRSSCLLSLLIASAASAVTMDWTFIGDPGNAADDTGYGAVNYAYNIGTYEVTNSQYAAFLNAKAASDPFELYSEGMGNSGAISRSGNSGSYTYSATRPTMPVNFVSFYDALRFANWLHNGQGAGDTETGAYTLLGGTATPSNGTTVTRNAGWTIALTSEDEWYKAAYYDAASASYFDFPAGTNTETVCSTPTATPNHANCALPNLTPVGSYTGSDSPFGTFDQGGNVWEWNETIIDPGVRAQRGGSFRTVPSRLAASDRSSAVSGSGFVDRGFRLAMIPEPGTGLLVIAGLLGFAGWHRTRA